MPCHFYPGYGQNPHGPTGQGKTSGKYGLSLIANDMWIYVLFHVAHDLYLNGLKTLAGGVGASANVGGSPGKYGQCYQKQMFLLL